MGQNLDPQHFQEDTDYAYVTSFIYAEQNCIRWKQNYRGEILSIHRNSEKDSIKIKMF